MLVILEFTEPAELIVREQHYIDTLSPSYNVTKKANSLLGFKHSALTRKRLREVNLGKTHSEETFKKMIATRNSEDYKAMKGQPVEVIDLLTNKTMLFTSQTDAANFFGVHTKAISQRKDRNTLAPYRGRYIIKFITNK